MRLSVEEYTKLKAQVEQLRAAADKAAGALEQHKALMMARWGVSSAKAARRLLEEKIKEEEKLEQEYTKASEEFIKKWGELLSNL